MQLPHWPVIKRYAFYADLSAYEVENVNRSEAGEDSETLTAMAGLSVCRTDSSKSIALVYPLLSHILPLFHPFLLVFESI